jgi:hypothetical protein
VNTIGEASSQLAAKFRELFPSEWDVYSKFAKEGKLLIGDLLMVGCQKTEDPAKATQNSPVHEYVCFFPTMVNPEGHSEYWYIVNGLQTLGSYVQNLKLQSVAMPVVGVDGGLSAEQVMGSIRARFEQKAVDVYVYLPRS